MQRPDLSNIQPEIRDYIEYLEKQLETKPGKLRQPVEARVINLDEITFSEPPTTVNILSFSQGRIAKRTPRHLYGRQHRGGMGVFDLDYPEKDALSFLACADETNTLLLFSNRAKVFRIPANKIEENPVRGKGAFLDRLPLDPEERIVAALPERATGYIALASNNGFVRCLRHHLFGEHMRQGTTMFNAAEFGNLASVCWTPGDAELLMVTERGIGIRFAEKALPPQGAKGIQVVSGDKVTGIASVFSDSGVFVATSSGKGTIRLMNGFAANKSPGGSGKIAIKGDGVIGVVPFRTNTDIFMISKLGKIIRFLLDEVPATEGVVQGVNCMDLRNDQVVSLTLGRPER